MGIEIQIDSLEEMCDLMCDNRLPTRKQGEKDHDKTGVLNICGGSENILPQRHDPAE